MKKECIFRCQINGKWYRVLVEPHPNLEGHFIYWTYVERRRFDTVYWNTLAGAIGSILTVYGPEFNVEYKAIWL